MLALRKQGKSTKEMARALGVGCQYVSNALWHVRSRNTHDTSDNVHHWGVSRRADELELLAPLALEGLAALLAGWNLVRDGEKLALQNRRAIRVELPVRQVSAEV